MSSEPWKYRSGLRLVAIPVDVVHALALDANTSPLPSYVTGDQCRGLWRMRSRQLLDSPSDAPWVTRFVYVAGTPAPVGLAGFHAPPDDAGMVEIGYRIDPDHRRRGYARQSLETLLAVAGAHPDVHVVRATIGPDNHASLTLIAGYGFRAVGEQWDDDDGLEIILECSAPTRLLTAAG